MESLLGLTTPAELVLRLGFAMDYLKELLSGFLTAAESELLISGFALYS